MAKKVHSRRNIFGDTIHYDERGRKIGESRPGLFGGTVHYDAKGKKIGESRSGFWGGVTNYDAKGKKIGSSREEFFGSGVTHYDARGRKTGESRKGLLGDTYTKTNDNKDNSGAEGIYGFTNYDYDRERRGREIRTGMNESSAFAVSSTAQTEDNKPHKYAASHYDSHTPENTEEDYAKYKDTSISSDQVWDWVFWIIVFIIYIIIKIAFN